MPPLVVDGVRAIDRFEAAGFFARSGGTNRMYCADAILNERVLCAWPLAFRPRPGLGQVDHPRHDDQLPTPRASGHHIQRHLGLVAPIWD